MKDHEFRSFHFIGPQERPDFGQQLHGLAIGDREREAWPVLLGNSSLARDLAAAYKISHKLQQYAIGIADVNSCVPRLISMSPRQGDCAVGIDQSGEIGSLARRQRIHAAMLGRT